MPSDSAKRLRESVKWFNIAEELFPKKGLVLAAVSGGPDSMALLSILQSLASELEFRVAAAYFDHGIRKDANAERELVESYARRNAVAFYQGKEDVPALAGASDDTLEEAARRARYAFLHRIAEDIRADRIATGHTRDDQAETVLMRVLRGTGIRGLTGVATRRGKIIRPLLCLTREDTLGYCKELNIPYVIDPSNGDDRFFRNRIRSELLPLLESKYNPGIRENLLRLAQNAEDVTRAIRTRTAPVIAQSLREVSAGEWVLNLTKISPLDDTALFVLFGDMFAESLQCDMDFSRTHYEQLAKLVKDSRGSGKRLSLPGLTVKKEYENLIISRAKKAATVAAPWDYQATLTFPGETEAAGVCVTTEILDPRTFGEEELKATPEAAYFPLNRLRLPLVLRSPKAGDRIQPFGMSGSKKLSDLFIDKKIPGRERQKSLVVADADGIVWVVGVTTSEKSRVNLANERVVKISISRSTTPRKRADAPS